MGVIEDVPVANLSCQPVSNVRWRAAEELTANDYNPNRVAPPERELLILSILEDGWTQPIVILPDGTIVDGFHRWTVSRDPRLMARYYGMVPTVEIDADRVHRKMSTVRHNRARGIHAVLPMASIVRGMVDEGVTLPEIQTRLGMEREEVVRLLDRTGMTVQCGTGFNKAWQPQ
jgi:hypothetical protein